MVARLKEGTEIRANRAKHRAAHRYITHGETVKLPFRRTPRPGRDKEFLVSASQARQRRSIRPQHLIPKTVAKLLWRIATGTFAMNRARS